MSKPLGGRGQKAPYETVQVRCPKPIKAEVEALISQYRDSVLAGTNEPIKPDLSVQYSECLKLVFRFLDERELHYGSKAIRMYRLNQFTEWLESQTEKPDTL
jgi:hypothetical protein